MRDEILDRWEMCKYQTTAQKGKKRGGGGKGVVLEMILMQKK